MRVHPDELVTGCLITKDVMGKTLQPIIPRNTVVKDIHITVLKKFMVKEVTVSPKLVNGDPFEPESKIEDEPEQDQGNQNSHTNEEDSWSFIDYYLHSVKQTKILFEGWQAGTPVDIVKIRDHLIPLIRISEQSPELIFSVHHYSNKDMYLYHHMVTMALLANLLASKKKYKQGECFQVALAAYLSDAGMAKMDEKILNKQSPLNSQEFNEVKRHPIYSYRMIENLTTVTRPVKLGVLQHHERLDGSGYPMGIDQERIHPFARIIAVADMFHAMTSERNYRTKQSPFKVIEEIRHFQFGKLDPDIVQVFIHSLTNFTNGTQVQLSDHSRGEIVFIDRKHPTRPMVRLEDGNIIDLKQHSSIYIQDIIT